jgi:hypothetical protein
VSSLADGVVCIFFSFLTDGVIRNLLYLNLFTDVVRFGINNCLWTMLSLADGAVSFLADSVVRISLLFTLFADGVVRFVINNCLWTVSSLADGVLCIFFNFFYGWCLPFFLCSLAYSRMASSVFYCSLTYSRMSRPCWN